MNKKNYNQKAIDFEQYLAKKLKNPRFKKHYDEYGKQLEIAYQILQLRKKKGLSQAELARKIGTKQSNIARMEAGQQNCTIIFATKIAQALGCEFKTEFILK